MAEPIKVRVLDHVRSTLAAVDGASPYYFRLDRARQVMVAGESADAATVFPWIIVYETSDEGTDEFNGYDERTMTVELICAIRQGDAALVRRDMERLAADVQRALHADHTRSQQAIDTQVDRSATAFDASQAPVYLCSLNVKINYRHGWKDPTSLAPTF